MSELDPYVRDALLLAEQAVRMAVKNHLIVETLRDGRSFDAGELERFAREEYSRLAEQHVADAGRAEIQLTMGSHDQVGRKFPGGKEVTVGEARRNKPAVLRAVAREMTTTASGHEALTILIESARAQAWEEVGEAAARRAEATVGAPGEPEEDYLLHRHERMAALGAELAALTRRR